MSRVRVLRPRSSMRPVPRSTTAIVFMVSSSVSLHGTSVSDGRPRIQIQYTPTGTEIRGTFGSKACVFSAPVRSSEVHACSRQLAHSPASAGRSVRPLTRLSGKRNTTLEHTRGATLEPRSCYGGLTPMRPAHSQEPSHDHVSPTDVAEKVTALGRNAAEYGFELLL